MGGRDPLAAAVSVGLCRREVVPPPINPLTQIVAREPSDSHLTRDAEAQELRAQLDRLESLLGGISKSPLTAGAVAAAGLTNFGQEVAEESAAEALGLLAVSSAVLTAPIVHVADGLSVTARRLK